MNDKGNKSARSYIAVVIILICALIFIFYLLESEKDKFKAKPMTEKVTKAVNTVQTQEGETTTTTILVDNNDGKGFVKFKRDYWGFRFFWEL